MFLTAGAAGCCCGFRISECFVGNQLSVLFFEAENQFG
jgi:hypothetical protein